MSSAIIHVYTYYMKPSVYVQLLINAVGCEDQVIDDLLTDMMKRGTCIILLCICTCMYIHTIHVYMYTCVYCIHLHVQVYLYSVFICMYYSIHHNIIFLQSP